MKRLLFAGLIALAACTPEVQDPPGRAATNFDQLPPMNSFQGAKASSPLRPNAEMTSDFLDLAFRMESGRAIPRLTRFEGPISVRVGGDLPPTLLPDLRLLLARLRTEAHIDIFLSDTQSANINVIAVPRHELRRAVPKAACFVVPRVTSWEDFKANHNTPRVDWTTLERRDHAAIFVPSDVAPQEKRDCLHEELAQALGPLNDLYRLPDSVFNDDNMHAVLTGFDMLVLRAYYAPELVNGMTRGEVAARLPALFARLNPRGERIPAAPQNSTSRDWIESIETALTSSNSPAKRRSAAEKAMNLGRAFGWSGTREGFALFAYGRLNVGTDPTLALGAFRPADRAYRENAETRLQSAHVAVQLAAFSLASGDGHGTLSLVNEAIPIATENENASLLATLLMFKAEALTLLGRAVRASGQFGVGALRIWLGTERQSPSRRGLIPEPSLGPSRIRT